MTNSRSTLPSSPTDGELTQNSGANQEMEATSPGVDHAPDALIGRKIGHFLIESRLGTGAMATVYSVTDQILNRKVALKVLLPGADLVVQERFRQEARTVSGLTHPHIVRTMQVGQTDADGITYIAMELVEGVSLADLLETHRQLSPADSCRLLEPIARALAYAHSQQVIHRDVKPSNVLLRRVAPGTANSVQIAVLDYPVIPLLSDFGIALAADSPELTAAGRTIGTPTYMAPEQCSGSRLIDGRADIYALGTVLYRCLAGRPPFVGSTTQVLHAHVYEALTMPEPVMRTLPPMVFTVLQRTLAKEPLERYPDAGRLAQDLARTAASIAKGWPQEELTSTMESLPATILADSAETMRVLVAAPAPKLPTGRPGAIPIPHRPANEYKGQRERATPPDKTGRFWRRVVGIGVALLIGLLLVAFGIMLIVTGVPFDFVGSSATATPAPQVANAPTAVASPTATATAAPTTAPTTAPTDTAVAVADTPTAVAPVPATDLTPAPAITTTEAVTPTQVVTTEVRGFWEDALALYETREWEAARSNLVLTLRQDPTFEAARLNRGERTLGTILQETLLQRADAPLWTQGRDLFTPQLIEQIYFDASLGLATAYNKNDQPEKALENLKEALSLRPSESAVARLLSATQALLEATDENSRAEARGLLGTAHRTYANDLAGKTDFCAASEQLQAATTLLANDSDAERLEIYQKECATRLSSAGGRKLLADLSGAIIYSTQADGRYQIYRQPLVIEARPKLLVNDGTQPQLAPNGRWLAFYNRQNGGQGLSGVELRADLNPDTRAIRYSGNSEDSRDSPPGWSPDGNHLVFASTRDGDRKSRIYQQAASNEAAGTMLAQGEDPTWHPSSTSENWIVYSGRSPESEQLGLWQVSDNGGQFRPLTAVEGDRRPAWSPDATQLFFMSERRTGNWEVYQLLVTSGAIKRLTDDPAQDGLPTVSPDGKYLAFVSDRGGQWQIWVLPLNEPESKALPVALIQGQLTNWLEHTIQWVK